MITSISPQNTIFIILTIIIISTTFVFAMTKKEYKRFLNISSDFNSQSLNLITFINHIFRRNRFKRLKHYHHFFL